MIYFYILLLISVLAETVFYPYPFTLLTVIMAVLTLGGNSLFFTFIAGLLLDGFALGRLGLNSLIFLALAAVILRYNRRISFGSVLYVVLFIILTTGIYDFVFYKNKFGIYNFIFTVIISLLLLRILPNFATNESTRKKLRL